jgi:hypothetical protein
MDPLRNKDCLRVTGHIRMFLVLQCLPENCQLAAKNFLAKTICLRNGASDGT